MTATERRAVDEELFAPRRGDDPRQTIAHYARAGLSVFAVHAVTKAPPPGYLWKARATSNVAHAVEDADYACSLWGDELVSIAWALGLDGCVALDLDDIAPEWWAELRAVAAINTTRRGEHVVFRFPDGLTPGNGTSRFPSSGWGEVRGVGGYIVIAGPDRPGFDVHQLDSVATFPRPKWLTPSTDTTNAATRAEVDAFVAAHTANRTPSKLDGIRHHLDGWKPGGERLNGKRHKAARHDTAVDVACWVAREAAAGHFAAADGFDVLRGWWRQVMDDPHRRDGRELPSVIAWAVGQLEDETVPIGSVLPPDVEPDTGEIAAGLGEDFWNSRRYLKHIRQAARARRVAPTAVLGAVLARVAAFTPPSTCVPAYVGSHVPLSLYVALIAATGGHKSSPGRVARDLTPDVPPGVIGPLPLGSGEGVADAYCEVVTERDARGNKSRPKRQTRHGALFDLDEGRVLAEMAARRGATIAGALCTAWTGGDLGQANATSETFRHVRAGTYAAGLVSLWQPAKVAGLFDEAEAGLPGRFLFVPTTDSDAPDERPPWPGALEWTPPLVISSPSPLDYDQAIVAEVDAEHHARLRCDLVVAALDAHRTLHRLKIAGLLADLDGRHSVDLDDWRLADELLRTSDRLRAGVLAALQVDRDRKEKASIDRVVRREVAVADTTERRALVTGARAMGRRAHTTGEAVTRGDLSRAASGRHKALASVDDMLAHAIAEGWLEHDGEHYRAGRSQPA